MAVVTLNSTTFVQVSSGTAAALVQFRGGGIVYAAETATPAANDWIIFGGGDDLIRFPSGPAVFVRAGNPGQIAVTRPF